MPVDTSFAALPNALITATQANANTIGTTPSAIEGFEPLDPLISLTL